MSPSIGVSGEAAGAPAEAVERADPVPAHEHTWGLMRFELVDDRPMVRQRCVACGVDRGYRAWERYWTPGGGEVRR